MCKDLSESLPCLASFDHSSFEDVPESGNRYLCSLHGQLICTNIIQEFLDLNKKEYLDKLGSEIWQAVCDSRALDDPEKFLSRFGVLVYADLKKYTFFYWFAFPALNYPKDVHIIPSNSSNPVDGDNNPTMQRSILEVFSEKALQQIQDEYNKCQEERNFQLGYFIVKYYVNSITGSDEVSVYPLTEYESATNHADTQKNSVVYFAYSDPSPLESYPGWPLRNFLCLIAVQFRLSRVNIIRIRQGFYTPKSKIALQHSWVLTVEFDLSDLFEKTCPNKAIPSITGWEKNESQQIAPKKVDLSSLLDPKRLAEDAVNLNLRLMKWRLLPGLNLDRIAATKCLILGCGTLGCHVARGLLAWGIKNITLVDNAKISYSNPVRQSLYEFKDCSIPNVYKVEAAADALKRIHPLVNTKAHKISIPMPGHHIADDEIDQTRHDIDLLKRLIQTHDAIFLLMDTRESRWLPTVISMAEQKLVINAAIGFDTFLLQRFGVRMYPEEEEKSAQPTQNPPIAAPISSGSGSEPSTSHSRGKSRTQRFLASDQLGCYFCNDIVAPGDSTQDRTLDQQCTVSRPGVSMIVSAMAVELLASIVTSDLGPQTPAPLDVHDDTMLYDEDFGSELGLVPHSIRGNLSRYHIYTPTTPSFNKCAACSPAVIKAYRTSGYDFLQRVFDDPSYLEELAGLKDLQNVDDNVWALESDDEDVTCTEKKNDEKKV